MTPPDVTGPSQPAGRATDPIPTGSGRQAETQRAVTALTEATRELTAAMRGIAAVLALAADAPRLSDTQLRTRLRTLADQLPGGDQS